MNRLKHPLFAPALTPARFHRELRTALGLVLLTLLARGGAASSTVHGKRDIPHLSLLGTATRLGGVDTASIRRLAEDARIETTRHLLVLSKNEAILSVPLGKLELVRALSRHEQQGAIDPGVRLQIVRALIRLFNSDHTDGGDPTKETPQAAGLRHWARGSAAMALVRSVHPTGLRALAAVAIDGAQSDPVGAILAQTALRFVPTERLKRIDLAPLIDNQDLLDALEPKAAPVDVPADPLALVALGKTFTTAQTPETSSDKITFASALAHLSKTETLSPPFGQVEAWQKAYESDAVWTIRALACLSARLPKKLRSWAADRSEDLRKKKAPREQDAAAWALSVLESEQPGTSNKKKGNDLHDPRLWPSLSTSTLRRMEAEDSDPKVIAILSSRLRTEARGIGPNVAAIRAWLSHESSLVRSAAARGLAHAQSDGAAGLLLNAYRTEANAQVRRALVSSLRARGLTDHAQVKTLLSLDPDPGCQSRAQGKRDTEALGFFVGTTTRKKITIIDREGRRLVATPAPDGFVGLVRDTL